MVKVDAEVLATQLAELKEQRQSLNGKVAAAEKKVKALEAKIAKVVSTNSLSALVE